MRLQKRALAGFIPLPEIDRATLAEALCPRHVAISLAGEPTLYSRLPELIDLLHHESYTTFLVSNGTRPEMLARCRPTQLYLSLNAPDRETYRRICRPLEDTWERICESLGCLSGRRSAVRITLVRGENDIAPNAYARLIQDSGATFIEVKGYMYLGSSRLRLSRTHMPEHEEVRSFAELIADKCDYRIRDESPASRVVLLERYG
jgi:tRNA wybutosine-synthesizing protein 1